MGLLYHGKLKRFINQQYTSDFPKNITLCTTLKQKEGTLMLYDENLLAKCWGEQLGSLRREIGMNQKELANKVGISERWLYMLEKGLASGKLYTYECLIKELGEDFADVRSRVMKDVRLREGDNKK